MAYTVFIQRFRAGAPETTSLDQVEAVLSRFGTLTIREGKGTFKPIGDDICEVGLLGGVQDGVDGIAFERPASSARMRQLIFELLALPGLCFFEQDVSYVLARTDVTDSLPQDLLDMCDSGACTVIADAKEIPL